MKLIYTIPLLFVSSVSANVIPKHTVETTESGTHLDSITFQRLLHAVDEDILQPALSHFTPAESYRKDSESTEQLHKDDPMVAGHLVKLAKRQDEVAASNSSITTTPSSVPTSDNPPPTTSITTLPASSSTTIVVVITTDLPVSSPPNTQPVTAPSTSTTVVATSTSIVISSTVAAPSTTSSAPTTAADTSSTPGSSSSEITLSPDVVLVTSTLPNGDTVTLTSYVAASTAINGPPSSATPVGQLQTPSSAAAMRPWTVGAVIAVFGMTIFL